MQNSQFLIDNRQRRPFNIPHSTLLIRLVFVVTAVVVSAAIVTA
jgi:hypothetical protein